MTHEEKIQWMALWAAKNGLQLQLAGECGIGRECVGVSVNNTYPDYAWYDDDYNRIDPNGDVWTPEDAYHKCECVAVLGRGEKAEAQLYEWLKWFDENHFVLETGSVDLGKEHPQVLAVMIALGKHRYARLVKKAS